MVLLIIHETQAPAMLLVYGRLLVPSAHILCTAHSVTNNRRIHATCNESIFPTTAIRTLRNLCRWAAPHIMMLGGRIRIPIRNAITLLKANLNRALTLALRRLDGFVAALALD